MFELKYFGKIDAFEQAEKARAADHQPLEPFDVHVLGTETIFSRAKRRFLRWFFLLAFVVLRAVWPVARFGRLVVVTRHADVCEVLNDHVHFLVPFGPEIRALAGQEDFVLGLDGPLHDAQRKIIKEVVRHDDLTLILKRTRYFTEALLRNSGGHIDILRDLLGRVFTETCSEYFGLDLDEPNAFMDRSIAISALIFADPFGDEATRRLAMNGAVRVRYLVDRAIARAQVVTKRRPNAIVDRLVAYSESTGTPLIDLQIHAIIIGTMTGLIPTNLLGAGKIVEELQRRDLLQSAIGAASAAERARKSGNDGQAQQYRQALKDILFEAARLNPALLPGQFRFAPKDTTIAGKPVRGGSVVLAAVASALRDPRKFDLPAEFRPGRTVDPPLMFGDGPHHCLGAPLAMEQITEILQILFSQPEIRPSRLAAGWLSYVGAYPRRMDFDFEPSFAPSTQNLVTIQMPIGRDRIADIEQRITALGNPASGESAIGKALKKTRVVHFASMSAFDAADPDDKAAEPDHRIMLELNVDGDVDAALAKIADAAGPELGPIFGCTQAELARLLPRQMTQLHSLPWGPIGLNFNGTPDSSVDEIERQEALAGFAREALDLYLRDGDGMHKRAIDALDHVRSATQQLRTSSYDGNPPSGAIDATTVPEAPCPELALGEFLIRPTRRRLKLSEWTGQDAVTGLQGVPRLIQSNVGLFVGLMIVTTMFLQAGAIHYNLDPTSWLALFLAAVGIVSGSVLIVVTAIKDGFDRLVQWWIAAMDRLACIGAFLFAGLTAALFVVYLVVRWAVLPIALIAGSAAAFWALRQLYPETSLPGQVVLAAIIGVPGALVAVLATRAAAAPLRRHWRIVLLVLIAIAAVFAGLKAWAHELLPVQQLALAIPGGAIVAILAQRLWRLFKPQVRRFRTAIAWSFVLIATAIVAYAVYTWFDLIRVIIAGLGSLALALGGGFVASLLLWLVPISVFLGILYWHERRDKPDERSASLEHVEKIAATENAPGYVQNHITAITPLKPGAFRKLTLAAALWGIGKLVRYWYRPGFVLNMGTIHYARWFRLPGSEMLVFLANYDGSWQSYLEDFVTKAHQGQSAAWSHGRGFPKTTLLVFEGAKDGDRFKRWVRRQQIVTQFWYSRFSHLTTDQIRTNALIHDGLMRAHTDTAARAWLDCFGTMPRPADAIETDEVQSLVFRGMAAHQYMICAAITFKRFPFADDKRSRTKWFDFIQSNTTFGEQPDVEKTAAMFVAFSAQGLVKCLARHEDEAPAETMAAFPPAFRTGMAGRAKILGDIGSSAPDNWDWIDSGSSEKAADVLVLIYGKSLSDCEGVLHKHRELLAIEAEHTVVTQPTAKSLAMNVEKGAQASKDAAAQREWPMYEHFGFRDGISQPIIRGSQREAAAASDADVVEAGEMILGYRNSTGYVAPAITLASERDDRDDLETDTPGFSMRFPRFDQSQDANLRDFGRNGTFLAVRQLQQHVTEFDNFLKDQSRALTEYPGLESSIGGQIDEEWVAAKMMGRWRSGASLISWPHAVTGRSPPDRPDNKFNFGADDPQGLLCPFGAHIRRANPRGSLAPNDPGQVLIEKRHRLLRRGRPYCKGGTEEIGAAECPSDRQDGTASEKGLLFVGLCADLERQFEFVQQTWVGSPCFQGLTNEPDPITSPPPLSGHDSYVFTIPTPAGSVTLKGVKSFVTVRAGGYFFMPSRSAIRFLARLADRPAPMSDRAMKVDHEN